MVFSLAGCASSPALMGHRGSSKDSATKKTGNCAHNIGGWRIDIGRVEKENCGNCNNQQGKEEVPSIQYLFLHEFISFTRYKGVRMTRRPLTQ
jgi:hypothetical protein